ncbi:MAG TPA: hypothetical protein VGR07_05640 [Thermoanaerobaculia bacterium]|nr:hypothetical protein [Thermoanaerobaculia bacterium]
MAVIEKLYLILSHAVVLALWIPALHAAAPAAIPPPPGGLGLLEAVRLLLEHDPNIAIVRA